MLSLLPIPVSSQKSDKQICISYIIKHLYSHPTHTQWSTYYILYTLTLVTNNFGLLETMKGEINMEKDQKGVLGEVKDSNP